MAEMALISMLFKLASLPNKELQLLHQMGGDVELIKSEVEIMLDFLNYNQDCSVTSAVLFDKTRKAAYDFEDAVDKATMLAFKRRSSNRRTAFYKNLFNNLVKPAIARRGSAKTIKSFATRLQAISESGENFPPISARAGISNRSTFPRGGEHSDALLPVKPVLVNTEDPKAVLITSLLSDEKELKVISVTGMRGLGKSTLVRTVFEDAAIMKHFRYRAWITSLQTFNLKGMLKDLIHQLRKRTKQPFDYDIDTMTSIALNEKVHKILQENKFLIVLDDVRSVDAWNFIKQAFPDDNRSSRVMLTTHEENVAVTSCKSSGHIYKLQPLSVDESWNLLCRKVSVSGFPDQLVKTLKGMLKKCNGLPLAVAAFCGVVQSKAMSWSNRYSHITDASFTTITKILLFSYDDLPYHLKFCFLYTSIFPEDHLIECKRLIRLWVTEGLVAHKEGVNKEQAAEGYLTELINRSLVQIAETRADGRIKSCRIHGLFRDMLLKKSREQNFASVVKDGGNRYRVKNARRLAVHDNLKDPIPVQNLQKLRTLIIFEDENPISNLRFPHSSYRDLKLLTVLDLQGAKLNMIFPPWIAGLFNLRFLSLRDTNVEEIPSSIGMLQKLQTLDLKHTGVKTLPDEICYLEHLCSLLVYHYKFAKDASYLRKKPCLSLTHPRYGFEISQGIECMRSLQTLCFVDAAKSGVSVVKGVGYLTELRRLGIFNLSKENSKELCYSIQRLRNLQSLSLTSVEGEILDLYSLSAPPKDIQRLYLTGKLTCLPEWVPQLQNLLKIFLKSSDLSEDPLQILERLPSLVHIELFRAYNGKEMRFRRHSYSKLRILGLHEMEHLERVIVEEDSMQYLERMVIGSCKSLKTVPQGIEHLSNLRVLDFVNMPSELSESISPPQKQGDDYHKVYRLAVENPNRKLDDLWEEERKITLQGLALARLDEELKSKQKNWTTECRCGCGGTGCRNKWTQQIIKNGDTNVGEYDKY